MTNLEKFDAEEKKLSIIIDQYFHCSVCGKYLETPQLAHRIPKTKPMLKIYGEEIIHHRFNMAAVCSLACNSSVMINPNTKPMLAKAIINKIKEEIKRNGS